jgi:hypothetical protein
MMNIGELATDMLLFCQTPVSVRIYRRSKDGNAIILETGEARITHVKTDYDGKGVCICIEESDIIWKEFH